MSVNLDRPPEGAEAPGAEAIDVARFAAGFRVDPRLSAIVPGFDAPFFQAGMAGYSDGAMRRVARASGCPYCVSEAILDRAFVEPGWSLDLADLLDADGRDLPLAVQLMASEPDELARAGRALVELARQRLGTERASRVVIELNLACPVKKVARKRRGGHWLAAPEGAIELLAALREALPPEQPSSVKLRRGSAEGRAAEVDFRRIFEAAYAQGHAWTTVHARTVEQAYRGSSRWSFLRQLRRDYPELPIFGSGDVWSVEDIFRMLAYTGVTAVSVARGGVGRPWIFRQARQLLAGQSPSAPGLEEQRRLLDRHFRLALQRHGETRGSRRMRKIALRYAELHPRARELRAELRRVDGLSDWQAVLERWYPPPAAAEDCAILAPVPAPADRPGAPGADAPGPDCERGSPTRP